MISRDDVIYAYRMLLGREPESEAVVQHYATEMKTVAALRQVFMTSAEFREKADALLSTRRPPAVLTGKPMHVELAPRNAQAAGAAAMEALFTRVATQWQHLGEAEPYWSVLTNDSYRADRIADSEQAFFATGEAEMATLEATLARHSLHTHDFPICLELGCGVGRATYALARRFVRVIGVDVSAAHLQVAQKHAPAQAADAGTARGSIEWKQLRSIDDAARLGRHDLMYSLLVLQHNPPPVMVRLLEDLLWQLNPGGVAYFQVPTYRQGYRFTVEDYVQYPNDGGMEMHYLPQDALLDVVARCRCSVLEIREDDAVGGSVHSVSNTVLVRKAVY